MTKKEVNKVLSFEAKVDLLRVLDEEQKALKERVDALKVEVLAELIERKVKEFKTDETVAKITTRTTFKYDDEKSMIKLLKEKGYDNLVKEVVDTTPMNNLLKKEKLSDNEKTLVESIRPLTTKNESLSVSVSVLK